MIIPSFAPAIGGAEQQVQRLSVALQQAGWSVHILTRRHLPYHSNLAATERIQNIQVTRLYSWGKGKLGLLLFLLSGLWYLFWHGRGQIYHVHGEGVPAWMGVLAARLYNGRSLVKLRTGTYIYQRLYSSGFNGWQFHQLLRYTDRIIVVNEEVQRWLVDSRLIPASKIDLIPNSVDVELFQPVSVDEQMNLREKLSLPLTKTIILYVGRLNPLKGIDILLAAWAKFVEETRPSACLLLVGDGSEQERYQQMCSDLQIKDTVKMVGVQQNVREFYGAADLFVLPSRTEGLSNALVEAMACGLPCVATAVGGSVDLMTPGETGFLVESENVEQLTTALVEISRQQALWPEMAQAAREAAIQKASLKSNLACFQRIYHEFSPNG